MLVDFGVEKPLPTALGMLPVARVLSNVGNDPVIETYFSSGFRIKRTVGSDL